MQNYQYKVVWVHYLVIVDKINEFGANGWELVSINSCDAQLADEPYFATFKRKL